MKKIFNGMRRHIEERMEINLPMALGGVALINFGIWLGAWVFHATGTCFLPGLNGCMPPWWALPFGMGVVLPLAGAGLVLVMFSKKR